MKKEDLRPVEYKIRQGIAFGESGESKTDEPKTHRGWFHYYEKKVSDDGEETVYAYIETKEGRIMQLNPYDMVFTDRDSKPKEFGKL